jgi:hypothetical protein
VTVTVNAAKEAEEEPSLVEIAMFEKVPTLALLGVPLSLPVVVLKLAQEGRLETEKVSVLPLGSVVLGVNE